MTSRDINQTGAEVKASWSWRHAIIQSDLEPTTRHVLLTISLFMNDIGQGAYPTTKKLAQTTGLSERTVCTHIQKAKSAGWLTVFKHGLAGKKWKNHEYEAAFPSTKRTEGGSVACCEGTEPNDKKALKEVQSILPVQHSNKKELTSVSSKNVIKKPFRKKKATRLTEKWVLPEEWEVVALEMGLPQNRIRMESENMRDWSMSSPNGAKLNWLATWRSWVRRAVEKINSANGQHRPVSYANRMRETGADAARRMLIEIEQEDPENGAEQKTIAGSHKPFAGRIPGRT